MSVMFLLICCPFFTALNKHLYLLQCLSPSPAFLSGIMIDDNVSPMRLTVFRIGWRSQLQTHTHTIPPLKPMASHWQLSIKCGIYQGDAPSPMPFCIALNPFSQIYIYLYLSFINLYTYTHTFVTFLLYLTMGSELYKIKIKSSFKNHRAYDCHSKITERANK